jgi:hypothetical protein
MADPTPNAPAPATDPAATKTAAPASPAPAQAPAAPNPTVQRNQNKAGGTIPRSVITNPEPQVSEDDPPAPEPEVDEDNLSDATRAEMEAGRNALGRNKKSK